MPGFTRAQARLKRFRITHLPNLGHVGVFPHDGSKAPLEISRITRDLALTHAATRVGIKQNAMGRKAAGPAAFLGAGNRHSKIAFRS